MKIQKISSLQNPGIKNLLQLAEKPRVRRQQNLFIIEGQREIARAKESGFRFESCYYCPEILTSSSREVLNSLEKDIRLIEISRLVYSKVAYRENVDGMVVTAFMRNSRPEDLQLKKNPLILILETVEKPGNLGAILRTADAAGLDAVIICDPQTDIFNPNVVRSSLGCLFSNHVVCCESGEAIAFMRRKGIKIFAAALQNAVVYYEQDFTGGSAFVMGSEADGLTEMWRKEADRIIQIPMTGIADSLNVSVSAAVLVFEAIRQRNVPH
jgi:TrmH family RNA methyltransferase